ncbi:probable inactive leucine-rich repeat receptor-like protein kinase At3g03770 [Primulina eburnea]|uniref:probable inactive leucine-rich repeat receptor-like protein kinase At3g03770 n=1 Tax=Primulina eburnea TaxID=1245227 RepID=UPI003C6C999A
MGCSSSFILAFVSWVLFASSSTHQLRSYDTEILLQLMKHLEYPVVLSVWENSNGDLCSLSSPPQMSIKCENDSVTELRIIGAKPANISEFRGFAVPNQTLSQSFSVDSLFTTLTRLSSLRVLSLVSLGIWGPLPDKIHRLSLLEGLDLSSNFLYGSIPSEISRLVKLQTLTLDGNFFNDTVPEWLDSLKNLSILSLKKNRLRGHIPSALSTMATLTEVVMSHNFLSGKLPYLGDLVSLRLIDLRDNNLDSELSPLPKELANVFLSNNSFSGSIPDQFGQLKQLQHLDLSDNYISGTPPSVLFSLPNISYLNLSSNILSGSLDENIRCGDTLSLVDLSGNRFIGQLPSCLDSAADVRIVKIGGNCFSTNASNQHPAQYCKDPDNGKRLFTRKVIAVVVGVISGTAIIVVILLGVGYVTFCKSHIEQETIVQHIAPKVVQDGARSGISTEVFENARVISPAVKMRNPSASAYKVFSIKELEDATGKFGQSSYLGESTIGKVFKGKLENGAFVAIRSLTLFRKYSVRNLKLRLDLLSKLRHPNLVNLLGHCVEAELQENVTVNRLFLVYEFIPNGNLHTHLSETCPEKVKVLKWSNRLAVLIDVAKGVHFLHTGVIPPSFNNRLKTNNVLIDEHQRAKLSDYGMSIIGDETEKPEAKKDAAKAEHVEKPDDDVYNFGLILFETLVGPDASENKEAFMLNEMASFSSQDGRKKLVDSIVLATSSQESLSIVISITNKCTSPESSNRPSFEDVLWNLQYAAQVQATADADQKSDNMT